MSRLNFNVTNPSPTNFNAGARQGPAGPPGGGEGGSNPIPSQTALLNNTGSTALPTAQGPAAWRDWIFAVIFSQTTDPGIAGRPWNDGGVVRFSTGGVTFTPSLDFSNLNNSMYLALLIEEL